MTSTASSKVPSKGTILEVKHANSKRNTLSVHTKRTLGAGNLRAAVSLPDREDKNEWEAANIVDFFNEISLLYGICAEDGQRYSKPGEGFPPGFEYRWADGVKITKPMRCSSPEYVDFVMTWVEDQISNEEIFPVQEYARFPDNFEDLYVRNIMKRLFRVFAIIYHMHFSAIEAVDAVGHLNTVFKHFVFFCFEFDLVEEKELKALQGPVTRLKEEYSKKIEPEQ
jgi:MOB kinase activator 1